MQERLQKIIARAGIASRRKAEELMTQGQVRVNGKIITELGTKADPERDHIRVQGKMLRFTHPNPLYLMLNKPRGCITSTKDPQGRPTVMDLLGRVRSSYRRQATAPGWVRLEGERAKTEVAADVIRSVETRLGLPSPR